MKKNVALALAFFMLFTACNAKEDNSSVVPPTNEPSQADGLTATERRIQGLVLDEYPELKITVSDFDNTDLISGMVIPINVKIENTGDKSVLYTLGSSGFTTPQALWIDIPQLQPVLPQDYLGPKTMDFITRELKPSETLEYVMYVMAVSTNNNFDLYTQNIYSDYNDNEIQSYIGSWDYDELVGAYPDILLAPEGTYNASIYFTYYLVDSESSSGASANVESGYAKQDFVVNLKASITE